MGNTCTQSSQAISEIEVQPGECLSLRSVTVQWEDFSAPTTTPGEGEEAAFFVRRAADVSHVAGCEFAKYGGVCLLGGELLLFPCLAQELLALPCRIQSPTGGKVDQGRGLSARSLGIPDACKGPAGQRHLFLGACEAGPPSCPLAVAAPSGSEALLALAPSGRCRTLGLGALHKVRDAWYGSAALGGSIYCAPYRAEQMLELEVESGRLRSIDIIAALAAGERSSDIDKWRGLCSFRQRLLFAPPYCAQQLLELEPQTGRVRGLPLPLGLTFDGTDGDSSTSRKFGGICSLGDVVVCVPSNADQLLVHHPDTASGRLRDVTTLARGAGKFSAAVAVAAAGHVVAAPQNAHCVLVYCPETDVVSGVDLTPHLRPGLTDCLYLDLCTDGQHVFLAPGNADKVLELVPPRFSSLLQQLRQRPAGAAVPQLAPGQIEAGLRDADRAVKELQEHRTDLEKRRHELQRDFDVRMRELKAQMEQQDSEIEKQISEVDAEQSEAQSIREALLEQNSALQGVKEGRYCSFWFLKADKLRDCSMAGLPRFQDLRRDHGDWFVEKLVALNNARDRSLVKDMLVISHRWEEPGVPDPTGLQLREIQQHLRRNPNLRLVWYDYWCLPQGQRNASEKEMFKLALPNVNLLYLSASVLLLVDLSYVSRFWTQLEAWLSMQTVKGPSLAGATDDELRCSIICIHNAPQNFEATLKDLWRNKTTEQAREILAKPDVVVTNASDKAVQLEKLQKLKELVKSVQ